MTGSPAPAAGYAGERLGLPASGPGSVAGWGRRVLALFVDWTGSLLVAGALLGPPVLTTGTWQSWVPLLVFFVEVSVLTALLGASFGQLALRLAVVGLRRPLGPGRVLLRTLLICLVVPPLFSDRDNRGLHDLAAGTVALRR